MLLSKFYTFRMCSITLICLLCHKLFHNSIILAHYSVFQWNWWLKCAPITWPVAWKEAKEGGGRGRKQGNIEHTVVPNVAPWNVGFQ
jgi:hypothetical protein